MVSCATTYEMEKQYLKVYTISKFRKVQGEFIRKVYYDLISTSEEHMGTTYEVCEDVLLGDQRKEKYFYSHSIERNVRLFVANTCSSSEE